MKRVIRYWDPKELLAHIPPEDISGVVLLMDREGTVLAARGESLDLLFDADEEVLGVTVGKLFPGNGDNKMLAAAHEEALQGRIRSCRQAVRQYDIAWEFSPAHTNRPGEVLCVGIVLGPGREIEPDTQERRQQDNVTGVATRLAVRRYAERAFKRNPHARWAVLRIHVEGIRRINYSVGQDSGDHALKETARRLQAPLHQGEILGRIGGNEFVALVQRDTNQAIEELVSAMDAVFDEPLEVGEFEFMLRLYAGVAFYPDDATAPADLGRKAAIAMEKARSEHKTHCFFSEHAEKHLLSHNWVPAGVKRALRENEFHLNYHPIVDTEHDKTAWLEALIRWQHPWRGMVPPNVFIPVAEEMRLMRDLDFWVIECACRESVEMGTPVAVNLTPGTLAAPKFLSRLDGVLRRTELPEGWLTLEITERVFSTPEQTLPLIEAVRDRGVLVAIDDFGIGYSSLSYLWQFPVDELKLDGSFIRAAAHNQRARDLVKSLVPMSEILGMKLVAEAVETEQDHLWLKEVGVNHQQGFYFTKPARGKDLERWLHQGVTAQ